MNARDKIADIISDDIEDHLHNGAAWNSTKAADAILAALPDMIPDLVWDGFKSGTYEIVVHEGGIADLFCHAVRGEDNEPELIKGGYITLISLDDMKETANTHHKVQLAKAMGWTK